MPKLPIGIQTFKQIIEKGYVYIDKTKEVLEVIQNYKYVFLSRPRRFGKSLFLDTLKEAFEGNKELFKGLYIYNKYDFEKFPVIKISWAGADYRSKEDLFAKVDAVLSENQENLGVECKQKLPNRCFEELIKNVYKKYNKPVVILIDEYDKPILNVIDDLKKAMENREFLKGFYEVIKDSDAYIRFAFLTGVSRFSKVSVFSGLNNLEDISLNPNFAYICGFRHSDLIKYFKDYLDGVDLEEVRRWYNGYNFLGKERVYNPFDILLFFDNNCEFDNYWFNSATPTFLIKLLEKRNYNVMEFENLEVSSNILDSFDIERIEVETVMFQAGYLTIKKVEKKGQRKKFFLTFPNLEVKTSFNDYLLIYLIDNTSKKEKIQDNLYDILENAKLDRLKEVLVSIYSSVPYELFVRRELRDSESYYQVVLYMYLAGSGVEVKVEDSSDSGRSDLVAIVFDRVYIFEFKLGGGAIEQIREREYYKKYLSYNEVYIIGVEVDKDKKGVKEVRWERVK